jgi:hypothetical protein
VGVVEVVEGVTTDVAGGTGPAGRGFLEMQLIHCRSLMLVDLEEIVAYIQENLRWGHNRSFSKKK